ncbi:MAG: DUF4230 domain-containing protein [Chitinophagaceae bacterium]
MKFFRNYIILILILAIALVVLQKMKVFPSFTDLFSDLQNNEEQTNHIVSSIKQMDAASSVYYIDQISIDTTIAGIPYKGIFNAWLEFHINLKNDFSEQMIDVKGKEIHVMLPQPELIQNELSLMNIETSNKSDKIQYSQLHHLATILSIQKVSKKNILLKCKQQAQKLIEKTLEQKGFNEIKIDFLQNSQ